MAGRLLFSSKTGYDRFARTLDNCLKEGMSAYANRANHEPLNRYKGQKADAWKRGWEAATELEKKIQDAKRAALAQSKEPK